MQMYKKRESKRKKTHYCFCLNEPWPNISCDTQKPGPKEIFASFFFLAFFVVFLLASNFSATAKQMIDVNSELNSEKNATTNVRLSAKKYCSMYCKVNDFWFLHINAFDFKIFFFLFLLLAECFVWVCWIFILEYSLCCTWIYSYSLVYANGCSV